MQESLRNPNKSNTSYLIKRFAPYFKPYKGILFLDLFCASLTTVCDMVLPLILRYITNTALEDMTNFTLDLLLKMSFLYLALRIIDAMASYYMANIGHVMGAHIETDMRRDAFAHLQKLSDSFYNENKVGQIMARITTDLFDVTEFAHHCPEEFFIGGIKILVSFLILLQIDPILTIILFITIPIMIIATSSYNHKMRSTFKSQRAHIGQLNSGIEDNLLGIRVVKAFTNEEMEKEKFEKDNQKFLHIKRMTYKYLAGFQTLTRLFDGLMYFLIVLIGGYFLYIGRINSGDLVAYVLFMGTLLVTVRRIVEFMEQFQKGISGIERFVEIMDTKVDIQDKQTAEDVSFDKGKIVFDHVSFSYEDDTSHILSNINLTIPAGQTYALVGPSGSGKTTICNLIPRFYDVSSGEIRIDNYPITEVTLGSLRSQIGIVQQDVYLFSGSVRDNIIYGRPDATEEEMIQAAKHANAYQFIMELPHQFDTYIGERGVRLSGGQKQRLSIARVFLKNPPILILDEATSALDTYSEKIIQSSLKRLSKGRTTLIIAHRLSTIRDADQILVLTEEGIMEQGNHEQLINQKGLYYQLHQSGDLEDCA